MKITVEQRVEMLLSLIPYYSERQYSGNYYDNDDLNDIHAAIERAGLTDKQREALELVYIKDQTYEDAAKLVGVSRITMLLRTKRAVSLVTAAYDKEKRNDIRRT